MHNAHLKIICSSIFWENLTINAITNVNQNFLDYHLLIYKNTHYMREMQDKKSILNRIIFIYHDTANQNNILQQKIKKCFCFYVF